MNDYYGNPLFIGAEVTQISTVTGRHFWDTFAGDKFVITEIDKSQGEIKVCQTTPANLDGSAWYPANLETGRAWKVLNSVDFNKKTRTVDSMSTPKTLSYIISDNGTINAVVGGKAYVLPSSSIFYSAAKKALKEKNADAFVAQCNLEKALRERSNGKVTLEAGVIRWNGKPVNNALTKRIYNLIREDFPFEPLLAFLENTLKNPEQRAVDELYLFLEKNALPITEDGHFLAYRRVGPDFLSIHKNPDGTRNRNKPGDVVTMPRDKCDADRTETCSKGLHFCSIEYLPSYSGEKTVIVKINPADVVAIPIDYNNQKGRCCRYEVVGEYVENDDKDVLTDAAVYQVTPTEQSPLGVKPSGQRYHSKRDPQTGRWSKSS